MRTSCMHVRIVILDTRPELLRTSRYKVYFWCSEEPAPLTAREYRDSRIYRQIKSTHDWCVECASAIEMRLRELTHWRHSLSKRWRRTEDMRSTSGPVVQVGSVYTPSGRRTVDIWTMEELAVSHTDGRTDRRTNGLQNSVRDIVIMYTTIETAVRYAAGYHVVWWLMQSIDRAAAAAAGSIERALMPAVFCLFVYSSVRFLWRYEPRCVRSKRPC